ncbi:hypothetical protein LF1_48720 [Rubripirellula obstinata]|uniref:Uncharacterized protein n=2 Tax=Rubripirellula obstinata TaxID=406547 RepID=A0A5B1CMS8_9BACT|nr:hypothetical protein [Rubripirellula obstinata]KAA1262308.1 hypothetical protein LF1_48720 [Rubripirellula obstinata]
MTNHHTTHDVSCIRQDRSNESREQSRPKQLDLLDHGKHSHATRAIACAASNAKGPSLRDRIELEVAGQGAAGATRFELHQLCGVPYTSVCGPVLALLTMGRVRETKRTRLTAYGKPAAVIVSVLLADSDDEEA